MNQVLRFLEFFALGTWLGGIILLIVMAAGVFGLLGSQDQAGAVVGMVLSRLHTIGWIAGVVYLVAAVGIELGPRALARPAALAVILMVGLTLFSQYRVTSRMAMLRAEMGSVQATPKSSPLWQEFDRLHHTSVRIETSVLLIGLVALFLTVRELHPR